MSQPKDHLSDETSDRLYTPEELASYAAAEDARNGSDPLTAQLPDLEQTMGPAPRPPASAPPAPRRCRRSAGSRRPHPRAAPQPRSRRPAGPAARPAAR